MTEVFRFAEITDKVDYRTAEPGIVLKIALEPTSMEKNLKTGIAYVKGKSECLLTVGDKITATIDIINPTKIASEKCAHQCIFGGRITPNQETKKCLIYQRT